MRKVFLLAVPSLVVTLAWGCSSDAPPAGPGGAQGQACTREADCDDGNGCTYDFCIGGVCDYTNVMSGPDEEAEQTDGDCMVVACEDGQQVTIADDDPPDDANGDDCMVPVCEEGGASEAPREAGEFCGQANGPGVCDGAGTCSCTPPSPTSTVFVDPVDGTDDASHGGAWGNCAFRTLDYALQHAEGTIVVPNMTFTSADVTYPIVLTGAQRIRCSFDDNDGSHTVFVGSGVHGAGTATIVFEGTRNRIEDCGIDGEGTATDGVVVVSVAPDDNQPHEITWADVTGTTANGIRIDGGIVYVANNTIHDNAGVGLAFAASDPGAYLESNTFTNNGTDVSCIDASPSVAGNGNNLSTCTTCENCNF